MAKTTKKVEKKKQIWDKNLEAQFEKIKKMMKKNGNGFIFALTQDETHTEGVLKICEFSGVKALMTLCESIEEDRPGVASMVLMAQMTGVSLTDGKGGTAKKE